MVWTKHDDQLIADTEVRNCLCMMLLALGRRTQQAVQKNFRHTAPTFLRSLMAYSFVSQRVVLVVKIRAVGTNTNFHLTQIIANISRCFVFIFCLSQLEAGLDSFSYYLTDPGHLDCAGMQSALSGTGIDCPALDNTLVGTYASTLATGRE